MAEAIDIGELNERIESSKCVCNKFNDRHGSGYCGQNT